MVDHKKVIKGLECCVKHDEDFKTSSCSSLNCPYLDDCAFKNYFVKTSLMRDALELLKEQDERYKEMVVEWLREMAHNNYQEVRKMDFLDAILEIRERATIGLENYFKDYKKGQGGEVGCG